jgi:hypothetical protein
MSTETKRYEGYWWLPEKPDKKVTGNLSINRREGIELRIISSLESLHSFFNDRASPEIILGQTYRLPNNFIETFDKHPGQLLTCLNNLGIELSVVLNNWFEKNEILKPAIILYVATLSTDLGYSEFRLLNYAQALEALHRRVFGGKYLTDEEYKPVCQTLTDSIPESLERSHRESLKGRIKYGHEFSQRKRIKLLLDEVWEDCLDEFIDNKNIFIDRVINTRNYLIHYDSTSEAKAVEGTEIFYIAERLKIILIAHILLQLGLPQKNVYRDIKRFANFEHLKLKK